MSGPLAQRTWTARLLAGLPTFLIASLLSFVLMSVVVGWTLVAYLLLTGAVVVAGIVLLVVRARNLHPVAFALGWLAPPGAVLCLLLLMMWYSGELGDYVLTGRFDAEVWRAHAGAEFGDRTRLRMVDDLRASGRLDGLTREQALMLLGEPSQRFQGDDGWIWWVGPERGFIVIDSTWLEVRFGPDGRVVSHRLTED